jgi:hypothetical protein
MCITSTVITNQPTIRTQDAVCLKQSSNFVHDDKLKLLTEKFTVT